MTTAQNPTTTHRRSVALLQHYRRGDTAGLWATLAELTGEDMAAVNMSLVGLASAALDARPEDPEQWLNDTALRLAVAEGDVPPAA